MHFEQQDQERQVLSGERPMNHQSSRIIRRYSVKVLILVLLIILIIPAIILEMIKIDVIEGQQQPQIKETVIESTEEIIVEKFVQKVVQIAEKSQPTSIAKEHNAYNLWKLDESTKRNLYARLPEDTINDGKIQTSNERMNPTHKKNHTKYFNIYENQTIQVKITGFSSPKNRSEYQELYQSRIRKRREHYQKQIIFAETDYGNKTGFVSVDRNISKKTFIRAAKLHSLTGQNIQINTEKDDNEDMELKKKLKKIAEEEIEYYEKHYSISSVQKQLGMCVIVPTYNNHESLRDIWNIESILQQNYSNYRVVVIDDNSEDQNISVLEQHLTWRKTQSRVILLSKTQRVKALQNIYYAAHKYCQLGEIMLVVGGDDELIGRQVFKLINTLYQQQQLYAMYTNHLWFFGQNAEYNLSVGLSSEYTRYIREGYLFRTAKLKGHNHLHTMLTDLFLLTNTHSLTTQDAKFYENSPNKAYFVNILEMSCGRYMYLPELLYWKNANHTSSEGKLQSKFAIQDVEQTIRNGLSYQCIEVTLSELDNL